MHGERNFPVGSMDFCRFGACGTVSGDRAKHAGRRLFMANCVDPFFAWGWRSIAVGDAWKKDAAGLLELFAGLACGKRNLRAGHEVGDVAE